MDEKEHAWHRETISDNVERTIRNLQQVPLATRFYLAGGTGLALQLGHRRSVDLDFFLPKDFEVDALVQRIQRLKEFSLVSKSPSTLYANIGNTKVSFIAYAYPVLFPFHQFLGTNVADPRDIGCMKLSAIASRGTKRDFVDLYVLAQHYGLDQLLIWFQKKYVQTNYSMLHVLKSMAYFDEAEQDPMPDMLVSPLSWEDIRQFFAREAARLL
jgi:predicted nucleotidyltransferase component of viral defense system